MNKPLQVVIDTNVFIAALRSQTGASAAIFKLLPDVRWENNLSPALFLEYEEQAVRLGPKFGVTSAKINEILNAIAVISNRWRFDIIRESRLPDPDDDFLLDLAVCAKADYIITYNKKDFPASKLEGITTIAPGEFLGILKNL